MGAVPSANYYESDVDLYNTGGAPGHAFVASRPPPQRHSYYENASTGGDPFSRATASVSAEKSGSKKHLNKFFTFRGKRNRHDYVVKSKSSQAFISEEAKTTTKLVTDESFSLLSSSYSIKSRASTGTTHRESTKTDEIDKQSSMNPCKTNNTSCSSGCSSAASSSNLSRSSRLSHRSSNNTRHSESPLSCVSTSGYQSSGGPKRVTATATSLTVNTEYDLFNINYLHDINATKEEASAEVREGKEALKHSHKNSVSSSLLNKLGHYLKASTQEADDLCDVSSSQAWVIGFFCL